MPLSRSCSLCTRTYRQPPATPGCHSRGAESCQDVPQRTSIRLLFTAARDVTSEAELRRHANECGKIERKERWIGGEPSCKFPLPLPCPSESIDAHYRLCVCSCSPRDFRIESSIKFSRLAWFVLATEFPSALRRVFRFSKPAFSSRLVGLAPN